MTLAKKALRELFPERDERRSLVVEYSGRFSRFNANVKYSSVEIRFSLSKEFKELSEEIRQGVVEHLLCKVYGVRRSSLNQELYLSFMKHLSSVARIEERDPFLLSRFEHINEAFFHGMMATPNLCWGQRAFSKLGHYAYATDTIVISSVFKDAERDEKVRSLLDFVLYHEMLHKKHSYDHRKVRARHHTKAFREDEQKWPDRGVERKLSWFLAKQRVKRAWWEW